MDVKCRNRKPGRKRKMLEKESCVVSEEKKHKRNELKNIKG